MGKLSKRLVAFMLALAIVLGGVDFGGLGRLEVRAEDTGEDLGKIKMASGRGFYFVETDGSLWGWGDLTPWYTDKVNNTMKLEPFEDAVDVWAEYRNTTYVIFVERSDGSLWGVGKGEKGILGENKTTITVPTEIKGIKDVKKLLIYEDRVIALKDDGTVWIWGDRPWTESSIEVIDSSYGLSKLEGYENIVDIAKYTDSGVLALKDDGTLWHSAGGAVVQVKEELVDIVKIYGSGTVNFALNSQGEVYAWGNNVYGILGNGTKVDSDQPIKIEGLPKVREIYVYGASTAFALTEEGDIYSWGRSYLGNLGQGSKTESLVPQKISGISKVINMTVNNGVTVALRENGEIWAWGSNGSKNALNAGLEDYQTRNTPIRTYGRKYSKPFNLSGSGTDEDPYVILSGHEISNMAQRPNSSYVLGRDITLNNKAELHTVFSGKLDGNNHKIYLTEDSGPNDGILAYHNDGIIKNLILVHSSGTINNSLVYVNMPNGVIENVVIKSDSGVTCGQYMGVVAYRNEGKIRNSIVDIKFGENATAEKLFGISHTNNGVIEDVVVKFDNAAASTFPRAALVFTGTGTINRAAFIGGKAQTFIGNSGSTLKVYDSYINGGIVEAVAEPPTSGGVNARINYSYIVVEPQSVANEIQEVKGRTDRIMYNSYYNISGAAEGRRSLTQLKDVNTYEWWDFDEVWDIDPAKNGGYPFLRNQPELSDFEPQPKGLEIEILNNPTEWTNQDITLIVGLKNSKGSEVITLPDNSTVAGTTATYTVGENGIYTFKANDSEGKEVIKEIVVDKIDKIKPTSPVLTITEDNKINIQLGTDSLSGIKEHQYKLNEGEWLTTFDITSLEDGEYTLQVKAIDNAGNESEIVSIEFIKEGSKIEEKEEVDEVQDLIDEIQDLIDEIQDLIDNLGDKPTQEDIEEIQDKINELQDLVDKLPNGPEKDALQDLIEDLQNQLDNIKDDKDMQEKVDEANNKADEIQDLIDNLGNNPTQESIDEIQDKINELQDLVDKLPNGPEKDALQDLVNNLQDQLDDIRYGYELSKGIKIDQGNLEISIGQKVDLTHNSKLPVEWATSDDSIVTVNSNGRITGIAAGEATITVTIKGTEVKDSIQVVVKGEVIKVTGFDILEDTLELDLGETVNLNYTVSPLNATDRRVVWSSSDTKVATVVNGRVMAMGEGTTMITGTTVDGGYSDSVLVTVKRDVLVTPVSIEVVRESNDWGKIAQVRVEVTGNFREIILPNGAKVYKDKFNYTIRENGSYIFSVLGKDGESTDSAIVEIDNIDNNAPIILFSTNPKNLTEVTVDVIETESGLDRLITPNNNFINSLPYMFDATSEQGTFVAVDRAGNTSSKDFLVTPVNIGGSTTHTYVAIDGIPSEWTNKSVTVRVGAQNTVDGVEDIIIEKASGLLRGANNKGIYQFASLDTNESLFVMLSGVELEDIVVESELDEIGEVIEDEIDEVVEDELMAPFGGDFTPFGGDTNYDTLIKEIVIDENTELIYKVLTKFGEYEDVAVVNKIDKVDPEIEVEVDGNTIIYTASDNLSGIRFIELPNGEVIEIGSDEVLVRTGEIEFEGNGEFTIAVEDYAGNRVEKVVTLNFTPEEDETEEPEDPEEPGEGEEPEDPEEPGEGENPEEPGEGEEPEDPEEPGEDENPEEPGEGENPEEPGEDENPEEPGAGENPEEPGEDDETEEPEYPSRPSRPYIPSGPIRDTKKDAKDDKDYEEAYKKVIKNIPYTVLKDSKVDWNKVIGLTDDELSVELDTSKVGVGIAKVKLKGKELEFKVEVVSLIEEPGVLANVPIKHWAREYVIDAISKGYIKGSTNGDLMLENTLAISDSFTAFDRLLLKHNLTGMNLDRDVVESRTKGLPETWYTYPVKSILSKYKDENKIDSLLAYEMNRPIRREEIAQILYNSLQGLLVEDKPMIPYSDLDMTDNLDAIMFCTRAGILIGTDKGEINPKGNLTRAEFMTILSRLDMLLNNQIGK